MAKRVSRAERRRAGQPGSANRILEWTLYGAAAGAGLGLLNAHNRRDPSQPPSKTAFIAQGAGVGAVIGGGSAFAADRGVHPLLTIAGGAGVGAAYGEYFARTYDKGIDFAQIEVPTDAFAGAFLAIPPALLNR